MQITFLGAAREVTGSRHLIKTAAGSYIMVDYGMEQGVNMFENAPLPIKESELGCVLLTHAHIDHSGWLPLLYKKGFRGKIYATEATVDLCNIMLLDSAHIQQSDAEWKNRKAQRSGRAPVEPLYTIEDAKNTLTLFRPLKYNEEMNVLPEISVRMVDVGHLLGSAAIEVTERAGENRTVVVFSGDVGNLAQPLLRDPQYMQRADYVVMESTYGDRTHGERPDYISALTNVLQETFDRGGNVVIPSFAVGRTQEMLYFIRQIKQEKRIHGHDGFPVYVDSPLAVEATHVFNDNTRACADQETLALLDAGVNPLAFEGLRLAVSAQESKLINNDPNPKVIISSSGMCDAGRIRHHLKHNLWRKDSTVLFVGYQSVGTLGRSLAQGAEEVKIFGETIAVRADIKTLQGISGHADKNGLLAWVGAFEPAPKHVFVVHGEDKVAQSFVECLEQKGISASAPYNGEAWSLTPLEQLQKGNTVHLKKPRKEDAALDAVGKTSASKAYAQLRLAGERLMALIERMQSSTLKEQNRLTRLINALVERTKRGKQ